MTEVTRYGEMTQTNTSSFARDGVEEWTMVNTGSDGSVISEMSGINTRRDG